ncbi:MAG: sulfurtransferase TusA family protein [Thermodesulfobacteriota bacterium]|nr:sulfurtransferase TusA family protein [Thermodesulfobacteriota bacterium]
MSEKIDARGLSCPQPVIVTDRKMKELGRGVFEVLVDTETAKENITRLAQQSGWQLDVNEEFGDIRLVLKKV